MKIFTIKEKTLIKVDMITTIKGTIFRFFKYVYINYSYNNQYDNQYYSYNNTEYYEGNEINPQSDPINHAHTYQMRHYE